MLYIIQIKTKKKSDISEKVLLPITSSILGEMVKQEIRYLLLDVAKPMIDKIWLQKKKRSLSI